MQNLSRLQKNLPTLILAAIIASYAYNLGFLYPTGTDAILILSYTDILNSSVMVLPFALMLYAVSNGLIKFNQYRFDGGSVANIAMIAAMFTCGLVLLFLSHKESVALPVSILFLAASPVVIHVAGRVFTAADRQAIIQSVASAFVIVVLVAYGYSVFHSHVSPRNDVRIDVEGCNGCRLVRMYSDFVLLIDDEQGRLRFLPNDRNLSRSFGQGS